MSKIIRAGWVEDAKTYVPNIIACELNNDVELVTYVAKFVDGLKKGWHVDTITQNDNGDIIITVVKRD